jgi:hypothetical protein
MLKKLFLISGFLSVQYGLIAQTFSMEPPYGKYFCHDENGLKVIGVLKSKDTNCVILSVAEMQISCRIVNDTCFISDDSSVVLRYSPIHLEYSGCVYDRRNGYNVKGRRILKTRYQHLKDSTVCNLRYTKWHNGRHVIVFRYKNGELHGLATHRVGLKYWNYLHYKNGQLDGVARYNAPMRKGKIWYKDGEKVKGNARWIHPKGYILEKAMKTFEW